MKTKSEQFLNEASRHFPQAIEDSLIVLGKALNEKFPLGIPRKTIGKATGGVLNSRHCANLDCMGEGIKGRFKIGRNTIYPVQSVIDFIKAKTVIVVNRRNGDE